VTVIIAVFRRSCWPCCYKWFIFHTTVSCWWIVFCV